MSDESQIVVPPSFIALFLDPGRIKPREPREVIAERHEFCEDLATMLTDHAQTKLWELGVAESDVLERIHRGLLTGEAGLSAVEAEWVTRRLAELLRWDCTLFEPGPVQSNRQGVTSPGRAPRAVGHPGGTLFGSTAQLSLSSNGAFCVNDIALVPWLAVECGGNRFHEGLPSS